MTNKNLIQKAKNVARVNDGQEGVTFGEVGCALISKNGNIYLGASIDAACGIGFCAEHSAIAAMITAGESEIEKIVAITSDGIILPPCGRCRELIFQINEKNLDAEIIIEEGEIVKLEDLLPDPWQKILIN